MNSPYFPDATLGVSQSYLAQAVNELYADDDYFDLPVAPSPASDSDVPENASADTITEQECRSGLPAYLPDVMRIQSLERSLTDSGTMKNRAVLFHERCTLCVDWISQHSDTRVHRNALVTIRHATIPLCEQGAVRIQRLIPVERARADINLFETIPAGWCKDRDVVKRAISLWEALPRALAHLVTSVFWDSDRFHRFVMGPSSVGGHHDQWNGNFRHAVEVADHAREIGGRSRLANVALLIAGGLLHDAAKADEYRLSRDGKHFRLSERGQLVGHRDTLIEWLAVAREVGRVVVADEVYLSLLHTINASKAPPWVGLRDPRCIEPEILSMADKLSGHHDLHERCAPTEAASGFGQFHKHLSHRTYVTPRMSV